MLRYLCVPVVALASLPPLPAQEARPTFPVWPDKPPGDVVASEPEKVLEDRPGQRKVKRLTNISTPTMTVWKPEKGKDTGAAVLICPGGGYNILAWDLEGEEVAAWLNSIGVTGVILKYRVPRPSGAPRDRQPDGPLQDAQRAMSLLRSRAKELQIDPKRIGMLGFSAGGHLTAAASTRFAQRAYKPIDEIDEVSCRPDFAVLVYPAYLVTPQKDRLVDSLPVTKETPPMFLAHAGDDPIPAENSIQMYLALKKAGVPADLHVYSKGGHGFGLRESPLPCSTWPARCEEWLRTQGVISAK